jgi:hypothetical protein
VASESILKRIKELGFKSNTTSRLIAGLRSLDQNLETILRSSKGASVVQAESGIHDISAGNARVNKKMGETTKRFTDVIDKMPKDIQSVENRYKRGILALFTQQNIEMSDATHFEQYRDRVKKSYEVLLKSKEAREVREGEFVKQIYDEFLEPAASSKEVVEALTRDNPNNAKLIRFFIDEYSKVYPDLRKNTLLYAGKDLPSIENYTATAFKRIAGAEKDMSPQVEITDPLASSPEDLSTDKGQSRTTLRRRKGMPKDMVMNLDFDGLQLNRLRESNYDVETLSSRYLFDAIRQQPDFIEALGNNRENAEVVADGVRQMVKAQRGFNITDPIAKKVLAVTGTLRNAGVRMALKGWDQIVKQYLPVASNTLINLGKDADLYFKALGVGLNNPIFNESGIGLRQQQKGGTAFEGRVRDLSSNDFKTFGDARTAIGKGLDKVDKVLSFPLVFSDNAVAKHSWLAYYMKDLRSRGKDVSEIDWATEHTKIDKEAAAYAEQMVSRNQIPNDPTKNATAMQRGDVKDSGDLAKELFKDIALPFTSFARNTQARVFNDIRKFYGGDKAEAATSLIATVAESVMFNAVKAALAIYVYNAAQNYVLGQSGYEDGPEKKVEPGDIAANAVDDLFLAGLGGIVDNGIKSSINSGYKAIRDDDKAQIFKVYDPSVFGETNWNYMGVYGILPEKISQTYQAGKYGFTDPKGRDSKGNEYQTIMTNDEAALAQAAFAVDILGLLGVSGATAQRLSSQVTNQIKNQRAPVKFFSGKYHNKKSRSSKTGR